jgi:hypothetical protein
MTRLYPTNLHAAGGSERFYHPIVNGYKYANNDIILLIYMPIYKLHDIVLMWRNENDHNSAKI